MPARKHRKDKFGMPSSTFVSTTDAERISSAQILVKKLLHAEEMAPCKSHYVSWDDMADARRLARSGFLVESGALGCFYLTDKARLAWR